jgi:ubiquinone biosynthesis accessory factor UbiK
MLGTPARTAGVQHPCHAAFPLEIRGLRLDQAVSRTALVLIRARAFQMRAAMDRFRIDDIVRRLLESVPAGVRSVQQDLESNFRAVLHATLGKLDLVTREEFDTQTKVLERTRAKADALEAKLAELEKLLAR